MTKNRAVIFDLDDTLYPQIEYTRQCLLNTSEYIAKLSNHRQKEIEKRLNNILDNKGIEYRFIYDDLFREIHFDGLPYLKEILDEFWQCKPKLQVYENTHEILKKLKDYFLFAILTDGHIKIQEYKIDNLHLRQFFDYVLITDSLGIENRKPSVKPYQVLLNKINLTARDCIYIGNDPRKDFIGAKKIGLKTIRINQGEYKDLKVSENDDADFSINSISELINCIKEKIWTDI
ncbi:MAG: HAD family hydrolase [Prevotellaceae bacterium]|jgi:putative hydrolase of the HAD superfamily|nr:HAD family hydrolase [Prevotellaceae bacterium]